MLLSPARQAFSADNRSVRRRVPAATADPVVVSTGDGSAALDRWVARPARQGAPVEIIQLAFRDAPLAHRRADRTAPAERRRCRAARNDGAAPGRLVPGPVGR
ncbi:hypothetical protein GCM10010195_31580 [Kitasatospora griseola]|nr:hypothetical protein GCM10010195_31580 [Kitasatospora griseola]